MKDSRIKVSVVSYLNSRPFIRALEDSEIINDIDLSLDIPIDCASKLMDGRADIGLVPIVIIPQLNSAEIISDYCISADGNVGSVLLFSHVPLQNIKSILLDYQSSTSVKLVQILAKHRWKIEPSWLPASPGFEKEIEGSTAAVIIGDRALAEQSKFPFVYDLAYEWKMMTGLPFVFAAWVKNKYISEIFIDKFNSALATYSSKIPDILLENNISFPNPLFIEKYLTENIQYEYNDKKREAMQLFFQYLSE